MSHLTWVRGLKHSYIDENLKDDVVAPYVGAWVETPVRANPVTPGLVAPYVGAWVETINRGTRRTGLERRTLRGCVG